jgi:hypothetical protein
METYEPPELLATYSIEEVLARAAEAVTPS